MAFPLVNKHNTLGIDKNIALEIAGPITYTKYWLSKKSELVGSSKNDQMIEINDYAKLELRFIIFLRTSDHLKVKRWQWYFRKEALEQEHLQKEV